jgi:phenylpropionate dioxygenase-like ring-hydroxylating dioxygenase large terminal subunit
MREYPYSVVPYGWFVIGWNFDFAIGEVHRFSYFDQELIAYRGTSGEMHVFDAYCPHMGADLGVGGCVEGDAIRCPFHSWLYDADGHNSEIPYSSVGKLEHVHLRRWNVKELSGIVLVCHCPDGKSSDYPLPASFVPLPGETWEPCPETTRVWKSVQMPVQLIAENSVDGAHFQYVHRAGGVGQLSESSHEGWIYRTKLDLEFGGDRGGKTWATPQGPVKGYIETVSYGLGLGWTRLVSFDDVVYLMGSTPVSPYVADLRSTTWVARRRSDGSEMDAETRDRWVKQQNAQVDADLKIWTNLSYVNKPPLVREESGPTRSLRKWARQFYRNTDSSEAE